MEAARNLDTQETTNSQLDKLVANDNGFNDTSDIHNIHSAQSNVRDLIDNSVEFTDKDKERFKQRYSQILDQGGETDVRKINDFKKEIEDKLSWVKTKKTAYTQKLRANEEYFQDGAVEEYIESFDKASIEGGDISADKRESIGKIDRWNKLESEIKEQVKTFKEFMSLFPNKADLVHTLGKSDRQKQIDEYNKCKKNIDRGKAMLKENSNLFSENEREEVMDELEDSVGESQAKILQELKNKIETRKKAVKTFETLPDEYKKLYSNFLQLSIQKKEEALKSIEEKMKSDYRKKQSEHPQSKNISPSSKKSAAEFFDKLPIDQKITALEKLDSQFAFEAPLAVSLENFLDYLKGIESQERVDKRKKEFYESDYDGKINILKDLEKDKECTKKYLARLNDLGENKEIPARSVERGKKKWGEASLSQRETALNNFDNEVAEKKRTNRVFRELIKQFPPQIRQQNEDYWELNHFKRSERVELLEKQLQEQNPTAAKTTAKSTDETTPDEQKIHDEAQSIMSTQEMKDKRKHVTILRAVAQEAKGSQERNNKTVKAQDKTSKIAPEDQEIADKLKLRGKDHIITKEGTADKIVNAKFQQMDTLSKDDTARLQKNVVKNILDAPDQNSYSDNFQMINKSGEIVDADLGIKQAQKMEDELKAEITEKIATKNPTAANDNNEKIAEVLKQEKIEVNLREAS